MIPPFSIDCKKQQYELRRSRITRFKKYISLFGQDENISPISFEEYTPGFLAKMPIFRQENVFKHVRDLHIYISLIAPFYTIFGMDTISFDAEETGVPFSSNPILTISPTANFEPYFSKMHLFVKNSYSDYKFIPSKILDLKIPGLSIAPDGNTVYHNCTLFQALFSHHTDISVLKCRGNRFFGTEEWQKGKD